MIKIKWAELHSPMFLAGTNLHQKLDPTKRTGMTMEYNRVEKELLVHYKGETAIVPNTNIVSMIEETAPKEKEGFPYIQQSSQVSTPTSHVFEGPGAGKVAKR